MNPQSPGRRRLALYARIVLSAVALFLVLRVISGREVLAALAGARPVWLVLAGLIVVLDRILMGWKWGILLAAQGVVRPLGELVRAYFISTFYGTFLPTGIGGDVIRVVQVSHGRAAAMAVTASVVMERALGLVALTVLVVLTAATYIVVAHAHLIPLLTMAVALTVVGVGGLAYALHGPLLKGLPGRLERFVTAFRVYAGQRGALTRFFWWSFVEQLVPVVAVYCQARALSIDLSFWVFLVVVPLDMFITRIPISVDAIGIREGLYVALFGQAGLGPSEAFLLALVGRAVTLLGLLPGAFLRARSGGEDLASA